MDAQTAAVVAQLGREIAGLQKKIATLERGARTTQLAGAVIDGDILQFADDTGAVVHSIGLQADGSVAAVSSSPNGPVQPSTPTVTAGTLSCVVSWDGLMSDGSAPLSDFAQTQIHLSTINGFIPDSTTLVGAITSAGGRAISNLIPGTIYYVVLVAFNNSGIPSPVSTQVSVVPLQVTGSFIANLTASLIGNLGVLNTNPYFWGGDGSDWTSSNGTFAVVTGAGLPAGAPFAYAGKYVNNGVTAGVMKESVPPFPLAATTPGQQILVTAWVYSTDTTIRLGCDFRLNGTIVSSTLNNITVPANTWTQVNTVVTAPTTGINQANISLGTVTASGGTIYGQALLALPQVPGTLIQAGTITAAQIAAGVIVAGIVDGTLISGAQFIAHGTSGQFLGYTGTPATGNLNVSISPASGTDSHSNAYKGGVTVYGTSGKAVQIFTSGVDALLNLYTGDVDEAVPSRILTSILGSGTTKTLQTQYASPAVTGEVGGATLILASASKDLTTFSPEINLQANDGTNSTAVDIVTSGVTVTGPKMVMNGASGTYTCWSDRVHASGQTVSSTTFVNLNGLSLTLDIGSYIMRLHLFLNAAASAGQWQIEITAPGGTTGNYSFKWESAAGVSGLNVNRTTFAAAQGGPNPSVAGAYWATIEGFVTLTTAGALVVKGLTTVGADTWDVQTASYFEAFPL